MDNRRQSNGLAGAISLVLGNVFAPVHAEADAHLDLVPVGLAIIDGSSDFPDFEPVKVSDGLRSPARWLRLSPAAQTRWRIPPVRLPYKCFRLPYFFHSVHFEDGISVIFGYGNDV